ncbi:MAG: LysR family transcriptional regulator [Mangrovicoccus sp.]
MRPNPHQILAFAQAAREGSFTRAAQRLGVSQSAVTQHVDRLEKSLGSRLFLRSRDGLELTRTGHDLHELADRMLTLDQALADRMEGFAAMERGHLSVIANAPRPALEIIARFKQQHPDVELDFTLFDWTTAMGMLRERRADVAIVTAPDRIGSAVSHRIGGARYVAYLPKDHAWAKRPAISLSEMVTEVLLLPEEGSFTQKVVRRKLAAFDLMPKRQLRSTLN